MSTAIAKNFQFGNDPTPANNFTMYQPATPDGTVRLGNGNTGTTSAQVVLTSAGNVGIGVVPSADWRTSDRKNIQLAGGAISAGETFTVLYSNTVLDSSAVNKYLYNGTAASYSQSSAGHIWSTAASGTAGNTITFNERMRIDSAGNVGIGKTNPATALDVNGTVTATTFTGALASGVTATTQAAKTSDTTVATTAFVDRLRSLLAPSTGSGGGTAVVGDRGSLLSVTAGVTVPANVFAANDTFSIYNNSASNITITQGASLTLRQVGTANTGNRTLAQRGLVTVVFISATEAVISGGGLT